MIMIANNALLVVAIMVTFGLSIDATAQLEKPAKPIQWHGRGAGAIGAALKADAKRQVASAKAAAKLTAPKTHNRKPTNSPTAQN